MLWWAPCGCQVRCAKWAFDWMTFNQAVSLCLLSFAQRQVWKTQAYRFVECHSKNGSFPFLLHSVKTMKDTGIPLSWIVMARWWKAKRRWYLEIFENHRNPSRIIDYCLQYSSMLYFQFPKRSRYQYTSFTSFWRIPSIVATIKFRPFNHSEPNLTQKTKTQIVVQGCPRLRIYLVYEHDVFLSFS